jgi:hypothetical protein
MQLIDIQNKMTIEGSLCTAAPGELRYLGWKMPGARLY